MKKEIKISKVDVLALAKDLAFDSTCDVLIEDDESQVYFCELNLYEKDGKTFKPDVQVEFDRWVEIYLGRIEACTEPEQVKDYFFLLKDSNGHAMATVSACTDELLNARFKEAVNDYFKADIDNDLNIVALSMTKIQSDGIYGVLVSVFQTCHSVYVEPILNY